MACVEGANVGVTLLRRLHASVTNGLTAFALRGVEAADHIAVTVRILKFLACIRFIVLTRINSYATQTVLDTTVKVKVSHNRPR